MGKLKAKKPSVVEPGHSKGLLFGRPGAGKTWFALNFPAPYFIDTEGGAHLGQYMKKLEKSGGAYMGPNDGSCDFKVLLEEIKSLATEKHPYKTLVIDSITKIYQASIAGEAERLGPKDVFGASKKPAIAEMRRLINWITRLDMNVWFIAHEVSEWGGTGNDRKEIGKAPDAWDKLSYELDLALRIEHVNRGLRIATVTKSRLTGFPEFDKIVLQEGESDLGYAEFAKRYGRDYIEAESKTVDLCSGDQVSKIEKLLSVLKIDEGELEKMLARANADTLAELSKEHAEKMVSWLEEKIK